MCRFLLRCGLMLLLATLAGCGNKGPLVLPDAPPPASTIAPAAATSVG